MDLLKLTDLDVTGKRVLLRLDLDTDNIQLTDHRLQSSVETLDYLKEKNASEIIIFAHKGRPTHEASDGKPAFNESLSLKPFQPLFDKWGARVEENLRFDSGEESNDLEFAKKLASMGDVFVNEAFASSHRSHASIVSLPKLLPSAIGFRFVGEIENLSRVFENPKRPLVFLISGLKEDKITYIKTFENMADRILVGGRLPDFLGDAALESVRMKDDKDKVIVGNLIMDKEDITLNTVEVFDKEVKSAGTIVVSGPLGKYEEEGHRMGTEKVFKAVTASSAFKIAGGGDTEKAIAALDLSNEFDWISVGGGAMLEFLSKKTLPGIEALQK